MPCRLAFNDPTALFATVEDGAQQARPVPFRQAGRTGPELFMPGLNPAAGILTSFDDPGRKGECGERTRHGWDGRDWRLLDLRTIPDCPQVSAASWPSLFRSRQR